MQIQKIKTQSIDTLLEKKFIDSLNELVEEVGEPRVMTKINSYLEGENYGFRVYKKRVTKKERVGNATLEEYIK